MGSLITILLPKLIPIVSTYGSYRFECAIRGVTLLGIFGLGGIGTELYLTLKSFEFNEMWTCLWMLWLVIILLEKFIRFFRSYFSEDISLKNSFLISISIFTLSLSLGISWLYNLNFELFTPLSFSYLNLPSFVEIRNEFHPLHLLKLSITTILITFFASGIAIGTPPLLLLLFPGNFSLKVQNLIWIFFRLIPPPLTTILILLFTNPNISVAALSLGITHMGVMGRLLTDNILHQEKSIYRAIKSNGSGKKSSHDTHMGNS
jgi:phosphonate transport system permease protein